MANFRNVEPIGPSESPLFAYLERYPDPTSSENRRYSMKIHYRERVRKFDLHFSIFRPPHPLFRRGARQGAGRRDIEAVICILLKCMLWLNFALASQLCAISSLIISGSVRYRAQQKENFLLCL